MGLCDAYDSLYITEIYVNFLNIKVMTINLFFSIYKSADEWGAYPD